MINSCFIVSYKSRMHRPEALMSGVFCQIWIALCMFLILAFAKRRWRVDPALYSFSQICGITPFEKVYINERFGRLAALVPIDYTTILFSKSNF